MVLKDNKELKCPNIRINRVRYDKCSATPRFLQITDEAYM